METILGRFRNLNLMSFSLEDLTPPILARFYEKIVVLDNGAGCWEWNGYFDRGMPFLHIRKDHSISAARISYAIANKKLPGNRRIVQLCGNKACVHPDHLTRGRYIHIEDSISDLPVCRERKRQLRRVMAGLCIKAACHDPLITSLHCKKHAVENRENQRRRCGSVRRNNSMSYRL